MSDDSLHQFAANIVHEIEAGLSDEAPFTEEVFTRFLLERLEDAGHLENTFDLYQEGRIRNAGYRIDGYAFDEDRHFGGSCGGGACAFADVTLDAAKNAAKPLSMED
ncbi:MAG: hypothetical protein GEU87_09890 [Alphaproteobacteria bacterium]|nr:hypothetical protein [Alphaproteobacteria bacterium]